MHPSPMFKVETVREIMEHIRLYPLATIAAAPAGRVLIAQAPVLARDCNGGVALDFHLSRNNALAAFIEGGFDAVAVNLGPEAYVSPDGYAGADQVPTWNYMSVEAAGAVTALDQPALIAQLDDLSAQEEIKLKPKPPWTREKMSEGRFEAMLGGIVGARLTVSRLEACFKLSQNKSREDREGVILALGEHPVARAMQALK